MAAVSCRHVHAIGSRYLDRELGWLARARLRSHLRICPPCIAYLDQLRQTVALLRDCALSGSDVQAEDCMLNLLSLSDRAAESRG